MATTQNISSTAGQAQNVDFTKADATTNDKVMLIVYNNGAQVLKKNSAANGGSTDEIAIVASTKYTVKFSAADMDAIPSGATYILFVIPAVEVQDMRLFIGTFTVASASVTVPALKKAAQSYSYSQYFTEDGQLDLSLPAGGYIEKILLEDLAGPAVVIDIGSTDAGDEIVADASIGNGTDFLDATLVAAYFGSTETDIFVTSADWNSGGVKVTVIWKELSI